MTLPPPVVTDDEAISFVRKRGGRLYVWLSDAGIEHETATPREVIRFRSISTTGFEPCVDKAIEPANQWRIVFHRSPKAHVRALLEWRRVQPEWRSDAVVGGKRTVGSLMVCGSPYGPGRDGTERRVASASFAAWCPA
jgi:hypothetical protein